LVAYGGLFTEGDGEDKKKDLDGNGNGLPSRGRVVFFTPVFELALKMKLDVEVDGAGWRLAYVLGPHAGEVLTYRTHGVLHFVSLNGMTTGHNSSTYVARLKELKDQDWVFVIKQVRVNVVCSAKYEPSFPMSIGCIGS
jgi:hypothetical protein